MAYDYIKEVNKLLEKKDWEGNDIAWYFGRVARNINEFEDRFFKDKKKKEAMKAIEEAGALLFIVANLAEKAFAKPKTKAKAKPKAKKAKPKIIDVDPPKK